MSQMASRNYTAVDAAAWEPENDARFPLAGLSRWTADDGAAAVFLRDLFVAYALWLDGKPPAARIEELDAAAPAYFGRVRASALKSVVGAFSASLRASIGWVSKISPWTQLSTPGQAFAVPGGTNKTAAALLVPPGCASVGEHLWQLRQQGLSAVHQVRCTNLSAACSPTAAQPDSCRAALRAARRASRRASRCCVPA